MSASTSAAAHRTAERTSWVVRALLAALLVAGAVLAGPTDARSAAPPQEPCPDGSFCVYTGKDFTGQRHDVSVHSSTFAMEQCVTLEHEGEALSFVNNTDHPVTAYQDPHCDSDADFTTYPAKTHAPQPPFVIRAVKVWSH